MPAPSCTRSRESPEVSLDAIAERLQTGLDFAARQGSSHADAERALTPADKLAARYRERGGRENLAPAQVDGDAVEIQQAGGMRCAWGVFRRHGLQWQAGVHGCVTS